MKMTNALTRPGFNQFQTENMDPALTLIGVNLTKFEKRKQVAARLLGYSSYEAVVFDDALYDHLPITGELLVAKSPHIRNMVLFVYDGGAVGITESYGTIYAWDDPELTINSITEARLSTASEVYKGALQFPFEQSFIDLGFHGPKLFNVGIMRQHRLRIEFDWVARNGMIFPLIIKAKTTLSKKPSQTFVSSDFFISFEVASDAGPSEVFTASISREDEFTSTQPCSQVTHEMILWELSKVKPHPKWSTSPALIAESLDCIKIAYAFLDSQSKTKTKQSFSRGALKKLMEKWAGRYISEEDVNLAIKLHPALQGQAQNVNISTKLVFPSYARLNGIKDAWTHDYQFTQDFDEDILSVFKFMEMSPGGELAAMNVDDVLANQQKCTSSAVNAKKPVS